MVKAGADSPPVGRRFVLIVVLVSLALSAPMLAAGYWMDDYYFGSELTTLDKPFGLYDFGDKLHTAQIAPWWASPEFRISFFRPLSSATLYLDFFVWRGNATLAHLHSALWFVLLLLGALRLLQRLLPPRQTRWAAVIFAVSACHAFTVGWIAARHAALGGAIAAWSLFFYFAWRQEGARKNAVFSLALYVLGLLASETALAVAALVVAYELVGAQGAWRARLAAAAPYVGLGLVYVLFYKLAGYGAYGSGVYADPSVHPGRFLGALPGKTVSMIATYLFGVPTSLSYMPGMEHIPVVLGTFALVLLGVGVAVTWRHLSPDLRRQARWLGLGCLLALAPGLAALPQGRSAAMSFCAFSALAGLVVAGLFAARPAWPGRLLPLGTALLLCLGLVVTSPLLRLALGGVGLKGGQDEVKLATRSPLRCARGARVFMLNGGLLFSIKTPFVVAHHRGRFFRGWHQLTEPGNDIKVQRTGKNTLVVSGGDEPVINPFVLRLMRPHEDLKAGRVVNRPYLQSKVLAAKAGHPTRVRFTIPHLDDPQRVCLLRFDTKEGLLQPVDLKVGAKPLTIKWHRPQ